MRGWILLALVLSMATAASAQYASQRTFYVKRADNTGVNGDSGSVVGLYPCENGALADSAGRRVDATWDPLTGGWIAEVDTTDAYTFFYRTGCCSDTMSYALQCVPLVGPNVRAGSVPWEALEAGAAFQSLSGTGDTGLIVDVTITTGTTSAVGTWTGALPGDYVAYSVTGLANDAPSCVISAAVTDTNEVTVTRLGVDGDLDVSIYVVPR